MNSIWQKYLTQLGAVIKNNQVVSFGSTCDPIYSIEHTYLCELSILGVIHATGEEAQSFLHSQFTNDLNRVTSDLSQLSCYCNPKGRMLSIFRVYKKDADYYLILPRDVLEQTLSKLNMFKLRAKVELSNQSDELAIFGIAGPDTELILDELNLTLPQKIHQCVQTNNLTLIRLHSENIRVLVIADPESAISIYKQLNDKISLATSHAWDLHDIYSGIPQVTSNISESFIPQMTNLDLIDGVSFSKGCYPGQEVVARTHYLGKPNRRMYRIQIADENPVEPAVNIFSPEDETQPVGKIVVAQKTSCDSSEALVVLRTEKENDKDLHLGSISGPKVSIQSLPYSLETNSE